MKREVCMACIKRGRNPRINDDTDQRLWDDYKMVVCPGKGPTQWAEWKDGKDRKPVDEVDPPPWCEWKLEHLVLGQKP